MWDGFDHRKFPRLNLKCQINIVDCDKEQHPISASTENVGLGGVCVLQNHLLERFSRCKVRLELMKNEEAIECEGKISWIIPRKDLNGNLTRRYDTGIEFINLKRKDQKRIDEFIQMKVKKGFQEIA